MKTPSLLLPFLLAPLAASAATLVYEGFNYTAGVNTASGTASTVTGLAATGTGLTGNWVMNQGATTTNTNGSSFAAGGLSFGTLSSSAGSLQWNGVNTTGAAGNFLSAQLGSSVASALAPAASSQTIWMSYLVNTNTFGVGQGVYLKNSAASGNANGANIFGLGINTASQAFVAYNNTTTTATVSTLSLNTTYWLVGNFTYSKSGTTTTYTAANLWILSGGAVPASEGSLGTAAVSFSGSVTSTSDRNPLYMSFLTGSSPADPIFDEVRIGTSYADVAAVPEPSAFAAMAGLGALGLAGLRRRRRA